MGEGELLIGDGITEAIVRIGETVRRPLRPFSLTVQAYLAHLRDAGFTGAPLPLGWPGTGTGPRGRSSPPPTRATGSPATACPQRGALPGLLSCTCGQSQGALGERFGG